MLKKCLWYWYIFSLTVSLVLLVAVVFVGEFGCFLWAFLTWRIPDKSRDSLNLLLISDSQIPGYKEEPEGIQGCITRVDTDWYLFKAFYLALASFSPDAVIHLGDIFDEGSVATDEQYQEYKARHDKIFHIHDRSVKIYVAGDNDIGGEWSDILTEKKTLRFQQHFGPINDVVKLKAFQIVKINSASLLRRKPFKEERKIYNKTVDFINNLSSKLDKEKVSILVGHVPIDEISVKHDVQLRKLIRTMKPTYAFSGHLHEPDTVQHEFGIFTFTEYVVPTCSYRMGTKMMGVAVAVIGNDGSITYSILPLPRRYSFLLAYLVFLCVSLAITLPGVMIFVIRMLEKNLMGIKHSPEVMKLKDL